MSSVLPAFHFLFMFHKKSLSPLISVRRKQSLFSVSPLTIGGQPVDPPLSKGNSRKQRFFTRFFGFPFDNGGPTSWPPFWASVILLPNGFPPMIWTLKITWNHWAPNSLAGVSFRLSGRNRNPDLSVQLKKRCLHNFPLILL